MQLNSLPDLLLLELNDLYDAERRILKGLPQMEQAASSSDLKKAFADHLQETQTHVKRLEEIFQKLGTSYDGEICEATQGLIKEGEQIMEADAESHVRDAALVDAAQRIEHYEIAGYGTARALADQLGHNEVADLLQMTLDEEAAADERLTKLATGGFVSRGLNQAADDATSAAPQQ